MARKATNPQNLIPGANKNGRPKLTDIEREANKISRQEIAEITQILQTHTPKQIQEIIKDPKTPMLRSIRLRKAIDDWNNKNVDLVEKLDMRNIGAPKQRVDVDMEAEIGIKACDKVKSALKKLSE